MEGLYRPNVGIMVLNKEGKVLLGKRKGYSEERFPWQMPQGGIDEKECAKEAGFRELFEETGIQKSDVEFIDLWDEFQKYDLDFKFYAQKHPGYAGQKQKWLVVRYLKEDNSIDIINVFEQEFEDYKWTTMQEAIELIFHPKKQIYQNLAKRYKDILA